jgi:hypothetical protein
MKGGLLAGWQIAQQRTNSRAMRRFDSGERVRELAANSRARGGSKSESCPRDDRGIGIDDDRTRELMAELKPTSRQPDERQIAD